MTRRQGERGYFSRLAEPFAPSAPVLKARHDWLDAGPQRATPSPAVPVIEDSVVLPDVFPAPRAERRAIARDIEAPATEIAPARATLWWDPTDTSLPETRADASFETYTTEVVQSKRSSQVEFPRQQFLEAAPRKDADLAAKPARRQAHESATAAPHAIETITVDPPLHEETRTAKKFTENPLPSRRTPLHQIDREPGPPARETHKPAMERREEMERVPHRDADGLLVPRPLREEREVSPAKRMRPANERTRQGPRVHIGTIEIRAVLPQPAATQPADLPRQERPDRMMRAGAGPGSGERLARGLEWSYGLVQG